MRRLWVQKKRWSILIVYKSNCLCYWARHLRKLGRQRNLLDGVRSHPLVHPLICDSFRAFREGLSKFTRDMLAQLAKDEDVTELDAIYQRLAERADGDDDAIDLPSLDELRIEDVFSRNDDMGVAKESMLTREWLEHDLSFLDGRPAVFNERIHRNGMTNWQDQHALEDTQADLLDELRLQWHQLVGIRAMVRMAFSTQQCAGSRSGFLVADEVGLGKTAQQMGFNAFVNQVAKLQLRGDKLPPAVGK
jgi:hypothetical protein